MGTKYVNVEFSVSAEPILVSNGKQYVFKCAEEVSEGDLVVCETSRGFGVGRVCSIEIRKSRIEQANAWIICKLDLSAHLERLKTEARLNELKSQMLERKKELDEEMIFMLLAEKDPSMKAMLEEFKSLKGE